MQVLPAAAVEGKLRKRQCRGGVGDPEGSFPPMIAFSPFTRTRSRHHPLKRRARANRITEVKREVKTAGRELRIPVCSTAS